MAYVTAEARQELLDTVAEAADSIGSAIAALGDAYEQLDERSADTLEEQLFRPAQAAYGRAKRTHTDFAARHGLPAREFTSVGGPGAPSRGAHGFVEIAVEALDHAEDVLTELQDSMSPVEVGDAELRAGLAEVREHLAVIADRAPKFVSLLGR
jgi:hypothetical protein